MKTNGSLQGLPFFYAGEIMNTFGNICGAASLGPLALTPGQSAIVYFQLNNGTASTLDTGFNTSVNIFAGKAGAPQSITVQGKS